MGQCLWWVELEVDHFLNWSILLQSPRRLLMTCACMERRNIHYNIYIFSIVEYVHVAQCLTVAKEMAKQIKF